MHVDFHKGEGTTYDVDEANGNDSSRGIGQSRPGPGKCSLCSLTVYHVWALHWVESTVQCVIGCASCLVCLVCAPCPVHCALSGVKKESEEFCPGATESFSQLNSQMVMLMMVDGRGKSRIFLPKVEYFCQK